LYKAVLAPLSMIVIDGYNNFSMARCCAVILSVYLSVTSVDSF